MNRSSHIQRKLVRAGSLFVLLLGCTEPDIPIPIVQTGFVTDITAEGAVFSCLVKYTGEGASTVGLVWDTRPEPDILKSAKLVTTQFSDGPNTFNITYDLLENETYYVRAYGENAGRIVYGDIVNFESRGSLPPSIESFDPANATAGSTISISGNNFSGQPLNVTAKLGGHEVQVLEASPDLLTVKIPGNFPVTGKAKLSVTVAGRTTVSSGVIILEGPIIEAVSPEYGIGGDSLTIIGNGFSPTPGSNVVKVGSEVATVLSSDASSLVVLVPSQLATGLHLVSVTIGTATTEAVTRFDALSPWTVVSPVPGSPLERASAVTFHANGINYYGLGRHGNFIDGRWHDLWKFIPGTNAWSKVSDYPYEATSGSFAFSLGVKAYVGLGWDENNRADTGFKAIWEYDTNTDEWTRKADFPADSRFSPAAFVIDGTGYVGFGTGAGDFKDFWKYDNINDSWERLNDFAGPGGEIYGSFSLNGKGYVAVRKGLWEYDASNDTWTRKSDLPGTLLYSSAISTGERAYFFGGYNNGYAVKELWEYYPSKDVWVRRKDLPVDEGVFSSKALHSEDIIYIVSGLDGSDFSYPKYLRDILVFNPRPR